jgi:hypothetical protein
MKFMITSDRASHPKASASFYKWHHLAGLLGVVSVVGFYNALFAFSYLPLTEGWFSAFAHLILEGKMPYRDFYLYLTPFYPMALAAVIGLFGDSFFALRVVGVCIVVAIAVLLYLILAKSFRPASSMVAAITACIYYQSGVAHIPYDFTQVLTLFTLAATWMLVQAAYYTPRQTSELTWETPVLRRMFLAGLFAALAFLTKQSNGTFVVLASWLSCIYIATPWGRACWRLILAFGAGCLTPVLVVLVWLFQAESLPAFWEQIFGGALAAKGSLDHVFFSWLNGLLTSVFAIQISSIGKWAVQLIALSFIFTKVLGFIDKPLIGFRQELIFSASMVLLCAMVIVNAYFAPANFMGQVFDFGLQVNNYIIPLATTTSALLLTLAALSCFGSTIRGALSPAIALMGILAAGMIWGNGTSAGLSEVGVFTMLALAVATMLDTRAFRYAGFTAALLLAGCLIFTFSSKKFDAPYTWWGVAEPSVHTADYRSKVPIARGLRVSQTTADNIDALADSLAKGQSGGGIFAFPNIPIAYLISNQWPDSKVVIPWFDFLPNEPAREEGARLLAAPLATIVNLKLPPVAWSAHERLFRDGKSLGQRDIQIAISDLTEKGKLYSLDFSREVSPGCVLEVWHRGAR